MKYTIIKVNDRAKDQVDHNIHMLKGHTYINNIDFFNGNEGNAWDVINHRQIRTDTWSPYDGRSTGPLPGEYGVWVSNLNIWEYIENNDIDDMLVLEDDVYLLDNAESIIDTAIKELPENWDFLSLYYFEGHNQETEDSDIGKEYIHKSINQPSGNQAMVYSKRGASKILKLVRRFGIDYTVDCFVYKKAQMGFLNGYSIKPGKYKVLDHLYKNIPSLIDPENTRMVEM